MSSMQQVTSRETILKKIREGLKTPMAASCEDVFPVSEIYEHPEEPADILFARRFTENGGNFIFSETTGEFYSNLNQLIKENGYGPLFCREPLLSGFLQKGNISIIDDEMQFTDCPVTITSCEFIIARTGSILVSSSQLRGRKTIVFPEVHIAVGFTDQVVGNISDALEGMKSKYDKNYPSLISVITGPSRTADIEKTLVMGAHGPREIYLFLIDLQRE